MNLSFVSLDINKRNKTKKKFRRITKNLINRKIMPANGKLE